MTTTAPSVLISASGLLGKTVTEALIAQKQDFNRIGTLEQLEAVVFRDVAAELEWAAKPIEASGVVNVEPVNNGLLDFVPED